MPSPDLPLCCVVVCMGRLMHLRETLPALLRTGMSVTLVDYSCPDQCGTWAEKSQRQAVWSKQLSVLRMPGHRLFRKAKAYNGAAAHLRAAGVTQLFFLDADTLVEPGLGAWCAEHASEGRFCVFEPLAAKRDLYGSLLAPTTAFFACRGYDESFSGWGLEDMDMRLRLALKEKLPWSFIPAKLARPIPHGDDLRVQFYGEKDRRASAALNWERLRRNVRKWTGGKDLLMLDNRDNLRSLIKLCG